ncbi:zinc finger HIT domain-containing protein [Aspergillus lucknowensis]|uniref:HIT-type domain-containing protein n=1 Tax=Aspergillus lucknowensis TaxID=176173 RepID=A0ABR4LCB5_9EURO
MSEEESLLTNLCAICHLQPPKYRCPRCSTRTCSLRCIRRHKIWSQCSGVRDPAAYVRRNELATESAFDRDFNFITGIERRLERAEREAENRGLDVSGRRVRDAGVVGLEHEDFEPHADGKGGGKRKRAQGVEVGSRKGEAGFVRRAHERGVKVIRAPLGMSRGKENGSKWHSRQKCLSWTIEWVTDNGKKRYSCVETCSIAEAYDRVFPLSREGKEKNQVPNGPAGQDKQQHGQNSTEKRLDSHRNLFFYLHRPRTATKQPVLSPLAVDTTLTDALRGRVVLEFPTIYVLQKPLEEDRPEEEKSKFMLEGEYLRTHQDTEAEGDEGSEYTDTQPLFGVVDIPDLDEGKVLEVLKKDLVGAAPGAETSQ